MRHLPEGLQGGAWREVCGIECADVQAFSELLLKVYSSAGESVQDSGGMLNEDIEVRVPDGRVLCIVSYKGDIEGWRRAIIRWCEDHQRVFGLIESATVTLSTGEKYNLDECGFVSWVRKKRGRRYMLERRDEPKTGPGACSENT